MNLSPSQSLKNIKIFLPSMTWAGVIFALSNQTSLPGIDQTVIDFIFKKTAHMSVYAVLYLLLHDALAKSLPTRHQSKTWWLALVVCIIYALSDEFHQSLIPGRTPTIRDIGYDALGMTIAFFKLYNYI